LFRLFGLSGFSARGNLTENLSQRGLKLIVGDFGFLFEVRVFPALIFWVNFVKTPVHGWAEREGGKRYRKVACFNYFSP
jgi:hypothetical protein